MDNTQEQTTEKEKTGAGKIIIWVLIIGCFLYAGWYFYEQVKINRMMKRVRAGKNAKEETDATVN